MDTSGLSFNNANQTATSAVLLSSLGGSSGVPADNIGVLVTPERHIMVFGAGGNKRKIAWGHQESLTDFTPAVTNTAGDLEIQTRGRIVGGFKTRYGIAANTFHTGTVAASAEGAISISSATNKYYRKVKVTNLM